MAQDSVDLAGVFQAVTKTLAENQTSLNQADNYNQDHGTNMVQTFQTITKALKTKKASSPSAALAFAARQLEKGSSSSSSQLYAQNLKQASLQFKGKEVDPSSAVQLLQTLIGGGQQAAGGGGGDILGSLLGGLTGQAAQSQQPAAGGEDLLGSLLGGMTASAPAGGQAASSGGGLLGSLLGGLSGSQSSGGSGGGLQDGLDLGDLVTAGMAYMQAKQSGGSNMDALVQALMAASGMGGAAHRSESTRLVVTSFLNALQGAK